MSIESERKRCMFFTVDRTNAELWQHQTLIGNEAEFVEKCKQSSSVFIRGCHWEEFLNSNSEALEEFETVGDQTYALRGILYSLGGCSVYSDCFCVTQAQDVPSTEIYFVPRKA